MSEANAIPEGAVEMNGAVYMPDSRGRLTPIELVKASDLERDRLVRALFSDAQAVSGMLAEFKAKAFSTVDNFLALVAEQYGAKGSPGGEKGNVTLQTIDGRLRLQVQVADVISFNSEDLQACKEIVDQLIGEWSEGSQAELRVIVMNAFQVDKAGQINRGALLALLRYDIKDPRWVEAMRALKESISVDGTKAYVRFAHRAEANGPWVNLSLDIATAPAV